MRQAVTHWCTQFIGRRYDVAGEGPDAFNCWSFFRHVQRERFGRDLPPLPQVATVTGFMRSFRDRTAGYGWRKLGKGEKRAEGDTVLMGHNTRPHHIGIWVAVAPPSVLHCVEGMGSVLHTPFDLRIAGWLILDAYRAEG